jgi:hypothetical protein
MSYKRLSRTLSKALQQKDTITSRAIDRGAIACLELHIVVPQNLLQLLSSRFKWQGKIARLSTHMVGTQQVQETNDMPRIIRR